MLKTVGNPSTRVGNQTINSGNLVIATAEKGIDFSANTNAAGMTSELLNWYEEGAWTPILNDFTQVLGGGTITATGIYTRVGRLVHAQATIACAGGATIAASSGIGSYISGLPFSVLTPCPGIWVNGSSVSASGGLYVAFGNMYIADGWAADSHIWRLSATYFV